MPSTLSPTDVFNADLRGVHYDLLKERVPDWFNQSSEQRQRELVDHDLQLPDWYLKASRQDRASLAQRHTRYRDALNQLDARLDPIQDIRTFAEQPLKDAIRTRFNLDLDVNTVYFARKYGFKDRDDLYGFLVFDQPHVKALNYEYRGVTLLEAALANFSADEQWPGACVDCQVITRWSSYGGDVIATAAAVKSMAVTLIPPGEFVDMCRTLDIGAKYQKHLDSLLRPEDATERQTLLTQLGMCLQEQQALSLEIARQQFVLEPGTGEAESGISLGTYRQLQNILTLPSADVMRTDEVSVAKLKVFDIELTGVLLIGPRRQHSQRVQRVTLYLPGDAQCPFKEYVSTAAVMADLRARLHGIAYRSFFSRYVPLRQQGKFYGEFNRLYQPANAASAAEDYPLRADAAKLPMSDSREGGVTADALVTEHIDRLFADARAVAVPTEDEDRATRNARLESFRDALVSVFNLAAFVVPGIGPIMLTVGAAQMVDETFEGIQAFERHELKQMWAHLSSVALNAAFIGTGAEVLPHVQVSSVVESLHAVRLPSGQVRLWRSDLAGYESPVTLAASVRADELGHYLQDGKRYIRQDGKLYETRFDEAQQRWCIQHPTDPQAYQPALTHNHQGAWRHTLEHPQSWSRLTLLRRMGPVVDNFDDDTLLRAADVSNVSDNALRKMHVDNTPPPPELMESLRLFEAQQNVSKVIEQVQSGQSIDHFYLFTLPLITDLPRWPVGRVLQVFDGVELSGPSIKYGSERLVPGEPLKPAIQMTRADVLSGELPMRILAALDEGEVVGLLGGEPARLPAQRPAEFRKQLADFARARQPALFESLFTGNDSVSPAVATLQSECPGLSDMAAQTVLAHADVDQLTRLHTTGRVPLAMLEQARWYARQGRLTRAYAGLHMESMANTDSKRLALQALGNLPGWPQDLRLEIRRGSISGDLLDGIGSTDAPRRKYLVQTGPSYQAFNDRGEALNSLPREGDNFYASLMHALPDDARRALGVPHVAQSAELQTMLVDHALAHPLDAAQRLDEGRTRAWFKPPRRIGLARLGYQASGDGPTLDPLLVPRVQAVYPALSDVQANAFILAQRGAGKTASQIATLLTNRLQEWHTLEATLDQWEGSASRRRALRLYQLETQFDARTELAANALKECWRNAPLAQSAHATQLTLIVHTPLPELTADFSHVRNLTLGGRGVTDVNVDQLLGYFPQVEHLSLDLLSSTVRSLPQGLGRLRSLKHLQIRISAPFRSVGTAPLQTISQLESLNLEGVLEAPDALDFSHMLGLRHLRISMTTGGGFPVSTLDLPRLERLDLAGARITRLPPALFESAHSGLWSGLSLMWNELPRAEFLRAYEYVQGLPAHAFDVEVMVRDYCRGAFRRFTGDFAPGSEPFALDDFLNRWQGHRARFDAIERFTNEHDLLARTLEQWQTSAASQLEQSARMRGAETLRRAWYQGLLVRCGIAPRGPLSLDFSNSLMEQMAQLPAGFFSHIETLSFRQARVSFASLRGFLSSCSGLRHLDVSSCALSEVPFAASDLPQLSTLDVSNNPISTLDVSAMTRLSALSIRNTHLQQWPVGAERLPQLGWVDASYSLINRLPMALLERDDLLLRSNLNAMALPELEQQALSAAYQRIERARGLPTGAIQRFSTSYSGMRFPPADTAANLIEQLLPMPVRVPAGEGEDWLAAKLRAIDPQASAEQARQTIQSLRAGGASNEQISARLDDWQATLESMTETLNGWMFIQEMRDTHVVISAATRRAGALRILDSWRAGLSGNLAEGSARLGLNDMQLGELPGLSGRFEHIGELDLTGVQVSEASLDAFLGSFTQVHTLVLSGQPFHGIPQALQGMPRLRHLAMSGTELETNPEMLSALRRLQNLETLNLSFNGLDYLSIEDLPRLINLDLRNNRLTYWPDGALSDTLRTLDLSGNDLTDIEHGALEGGHDLLMAGTDLSDNPLPHDSLERIRAYGQARGLDPVLGFSRQELDELIDERNNRALQGGDSDDSEATTDTDVDDNGTPWRAPRPIPVVPDEVPGALAAGDADLQPWLSGLSPQDQAHTRTLWQQLAREPDNWAFFNLVSQLRHTLEYELAHVDLARRLFAVMQAAADSTELREVLFAMSNTQGTCVDGRILTFSGLEIKVYEHNALAGIDPTRLDLKGKALLDLSRQLFRLDQVEKIADRVPSHDNAETRLRYRIGLTRGWQDNLELPGQPTYMRFDRPIEGTVAANARLTVEAAERSDVFYDDLISRDYWQAYLKEKYPEAFSELERDAHARQVALEDAYPNITSPAYGEAVVALDIELATLRNAKLKQLSRLETGEA